MGGQEEGTPLALGLRQTHRFAAPELLAIDERLIRVLHQKAPWDIAHLCVTLEQRSIEPIGAPQGFNARISVWEKSLPMKSKGSSERFARA